MFELTDTNSLRSKSETS